MHEFPGEGVIQNLRKSAFWALSVTLVLSPEARPEFLSGTSSRMEILTEENLVRQKKIPLHFPGLSLPY